jgi:hypothetical protein
MKNFNEIQKIIAETYCQGDMSHVESVEDARTCGDGLFEFLVREAGDAESMDEYIGMVDTAREQLESLSDELSRMLQESKHAARKHKVRG